MLLIAVAIHSVQDNGLHPFAELLAQPTRYHRLKLLKVSDDTYEGGVGLLLHSCEEALPLPVLVLAGLVHEDQVDTPQRRWRGPPDFRISA